MKKKYIDFILLVLAFTVFIAINAFAEAEDQSGILYRSTNENWMGSPDAVGMWKNDGTKVTVKMMTDYKYSYDNFENVYQHSGLKWKYTKADHKLTISLEEGYTPDKVADEWVLPVLKSDISREPSTGYSFFDGRDEIFEIEIEEETGITSLPRCSLNRCTKLKTVTLPSTVKTLYGYSLSRNFDLTTVRFTCSNSDGKSNVVDLTNVSLADKSVLQESFKIKSPVVVDFWLSDSVAESSNTSFGSTWSNGTINVYTNDGKPCRWVEDIQNGIQSGVDKNGDPTYRSSSYQYNVNIYPYSLIEELGYQVRTDKYTGLRARFRYNGGENDQYGRRVITNGNWVGNDDSVAFSHVVEYGAVIIPYYPEDEDFDYKIDLEKGFDKDGNRYANYKKAKVKTIWIKDESEKKPDEYWLSIVKYNMEDSNNLKKPVFISAYQIVEGSDGVKRIAYSAETASHCKPASLYDATLAMYRNGLINQSVEGIIKKDEDDEKFRGEGEGVFWSVLDRCKEDLSALDVDKINNYLADGHTAGETLYKNNSTHDKHATTYDLKNFDYKFYEKDMYIETYPNVLISIFKSDLFDGDTAIAHLKDRGATGKNVLTGYVRSLNYYRENLMSTNVIGYKIDTYIVDEGITQITDYTVSGFGTYTDQSICYKDGDEYKPLKISYAGQLKTVILADTVKTISGQTFHSDMELETVITFDKDKATSETESNYVRKGQYTADISKLTSYGISYTFARCKKIKAVLLPLNDNPTAISISSATVSVDKETGVSTVTSVSCNGLFSTCESLVKVYCPDYEEYKGGKEPTDGVADLRGSGLFMLQYEITNTSNSNATFSSSNNIKTLFFDVTGTSTAKINSVASTKIDGGTPGKYTRSGQNWILDEAFN